MPVESLLFLGSDIRLATLRGTDLDPTSFRGTDIAISTYPSTDMRFLYFLRFFR